MNNIEIILLTLLVVTLFAVFIIGSYKELNKMSKEGYIPKKESGPRAQLTQMIGKLFDEIPKDEKKMFYKAISRTISDMESDGVYFSDEVKDELKRQREEAYCSYSGLPSVKVYEDKN